MVEVVLVVLGLLVPPVPILLLLITVQSLQIAILPMVFDVVPVVVSLFAGSPVVIVVVIGIIVAVVSGVVVPVSDSPNTQ